MIPRSRDPLVSPVSVNQKADGHRHDDCAKKHAKANAYLD